jgi:hypothetical protein
VALTGADCRIILFAHERKFGCKSAELGACMIRIFAYVACLSGFVWIGIGNLHFRQSIRTTLETAYEDMERLEPGSAGGVGKVLNSYYESVYNNLPATVLPASILMLGSTVLLFARKPKSV